MERAFIVCKEENSSEKGFGICREGHFIEKCFKMYSTTCSEFMVIGFIAEVCASGIEYFSRPVRQDLYEHIPDIHIYGTDTLLCDELTITARISDRAFSSGVFILTAKGNVIKEYYTEQLLQRGWIKGKNEKGEDFHFHTDRYDEFRFYKDGYTLDVFFDIPLDQDPDKLIWGDKRERYVITMTKTEFY